MVVSGCHLDMFLPFEFSYVIFNATTFVTIWSGVKSNPTQAPSLITGMEFIGNAQIQPGLLASFPAKTIVGAPSGEMRM
jgi:hypothetical protein